MLTPQESTVSTRKEPVMSTCAICHFETNPDDVVVKNGRGLCVCLRCFNRETGNELRMPKLLRRQVIAALAEAA
jgi:hypothetical protein